MRNFQPLPGMDLSECRAQLIWANERDLEEKHLRMNTSFEEVSVCWLILRGQVRLRRAGKEVRAEAGEWLLPAAKPAMQIFSPRARILSIRFSLGLSGGEPVFARSQTVKIRSTQEPDLEQRARDLVKQLTPWAARESLSVGRYRIPLDENLQIEAAFYRWLAVYVRCMQAQGETVHAGRTGDPRVRKALNRLENFPFHDGFSEGELAELCGLSVNQLHRLFKKETGESPFQYYDRLRLARARQVLSETGLQIKEIAYELGFSSSPHFTNWFKQRMGRSPRAWRGGRV